MWSRCQETHKQTLNPAGERESVSLSLESWHDLSCQSKCESLDVVCHFLRAGVATVRRFEDCGKKQCKREGRKCVFISVGGARLPLWSVCRAARGSPRKQPKPWGHCLSPERCGMMEVHRLAAAGVVTIKLHADAKFVDINHSMNGRRIAPNSKPADCPFDPNRASIININHEIKWFDMTRSMLFSSNETWRRVHGGDLPVQDMISWDLVSSNYPSSSRVQILITEQTIIYLYFSPPGMEWLIKWSIFHCLEKGKHN